MAAQAMAAEAPSLNALDMRCCPSSDVPGWEMPALFLRVCEINSRDVLVYTHFNDTS